MSLIEHIPEIFDQSKMPDVLYHYTTVEGFYEIIKQKVLRASDYRYFNDAEEVVHIFNQLSTKENISQYLEKVKSEFWNDPNYIILSFSEQCDDLAMWGRYSNDEGINLGFSKETINELCPIEDSFQMPVFGKCIYDNKEKISLVEKCFNLLTENKIKDLIFNEMLLGVAPFLKNESFKHEQEWRAVFKYNPSAPDYSGKPKLRYSKNKIIPYMNIYFKNIEKTELIFPSIEKITLAPKLSRSPHAEMMIKYYLECNGVTYNEINKSKSSLF